MPKLPSLTPRLTLSLSPQELERHRAEIGLAVEIVLDGYWHNRPSDVVKAGILVDWMDALQDWSIDQIRFGLRQWRDTNPSKKPNAGHIALILKNERGLAFVAQRDGRPQLGIFAIEGLPAITHQ